MGIGFILDKNSYGIILDYRKIKVNNHIGIELILSTDKIIYLVVNRYIKSIDYDELVNLLVNHINFSRTRLSFSSRDVIHSIYHNKYIVDKYSYLYVYEITILEEALDHELDVKVINN